MVTLQWLGSQPSLYMLTETSLGMVARGRAVTHVVYYPRRTVEVPSCLVSWRPLFSLYLLEIPSWQSPNSLSSVIPIYTLQEDTCFQKLPSLSLLRMDRSDQIQVRTDVRLPSRSTGDLQCDRIPKTLRRLKRGSKKDGDPCVVRKISGFSYHDHVGHLTIGVCRRCFNDWIITCPINVGHPTSPRSP